MKSTVISALMYLVIDFLWAFIVNIVIRMILHSEGGLIDWITVSIITVGLFLAHIRAIRRTAEKK